MLSWRDRYLEKLKDKIKNAQSRRSGEKAHHIYETYKNTVIPHGHHIYAKAHDMAKGTMFTHPQSDHAIPHWKCVLWCCYDCTYINLPDQETNKKHEETAPSIQFHIYHIIVRCTTHGRTPLKYRKICYMCKQEYSSDKSTKIYTRK